MPNQAANGRTGEDTWVAALLVPEMYTDLPLKRYHCAACGCPVKNE